MNSTVHHEGKLHDYAMENNRGQRNAYDSRADFILITFQLLNSFNCLFRESTVKLIKPLNKFHGNKIATCEERLGVKTFEMQRLSCIFNGCILLTGIFCILHTWAFSKRARLFLSRRTLTALSTNQLAGTSSNHHSF